MYFRLVELAAAIFFVTVASHSQSKPATAPRPPTTPKEDAQIYRNSTFGFRYKIPFGWVERTQQMQEGSADSKGEVLLAVFERPPEAIGDTINSAVVIATERAESYPGLKKAEDYLSPLTELTTSKGFQAQGDPSTIEIDGRRLVRADFTKDLETKRNETDSSAAKLSMRQSTLVLLAHHQIVSFTFIAGSEAELDDLVSSLHFGVAKPAVH
jgi:hypothetical protein